MKIELRINGDLFLDNLIDYTCPSFSELIRTWLESPSAHVNSTYIWKSLKIPTIRIYPATVATMDFLATNTTEYEASLQLGAPASEEVGRC
ncbi:hypothetical protein P879_10471 [Paragonimus westermani]|uniref:Uncharacterized protein n=1 Tax=Paragonimus westermani TaxID=34504 RepID=A0A8T0D6U4_9TREM|nr:hypothetical protein P879_10471 [Paragonimus westermani]